MTNLRNHPGVVVTSPAGYAGASSISRAAAGALGMVLTLFCRVRLTVLER
jgi:hypothetical protein